MNEKIKNVLKKIIDAGFEAYVVGGYVRDLKLGTSSYDVDIATSALPKDLRNIFDLSNSTEADYGNVFFKDKIYNYDITTFRIENAYKDRKPVNLSFTNSIEEDAKRRDFTINALYMDIDGNIIDFYNGLDDLENKQIKVIGNINDKMVEDPLRILRAIRFATTHDFVIDKNLTLYIKQNKLLIKSLSYKRKKEELDRIFKSNNCLKGIELLKELNITNALDIEINKNIVNTMDEIGIWAQIEFSDNFPFTKEEKENIEKIKTIVSYGIIDNIVLYEYGLYNSIIAGDILGINRSFISDLYKELPIYSSKDLKLNGDDIKSILNINPSSTIKDIIFDLEINILDGKLENDYEVLKKFILDNWRK